MQFENFKSETPIQKFYAGQNVLITGGTGFLGKLLIEKLLRCCPDLASIYLIIRPKGDQDIHKRIERILEEPIFDQLKCECPEFLNKIIPIEGDGSLPNFGISVENRDILLNKISIVFHGAANVKFNAKLAQLIKDNIFGTKELINICQSMKNLKVFMFTSTFYAHSQRIEIDEKFYDPSITADNILKLDEIFNVEELEKFEPILRKDHSNNYAYTKAIAEQLIHQYAKELPAGMFRPAAMLPTYKSPLEGWCDNSYGPIGVSAAVSFGLLRIMLTDVSKKTEIVPADLTVNALIASAWDVALNKSKEDDPFVYNCISTWNNSITWEQYSKLNEKYNVPPLNSIYGNNVKFYKNYYYYYTMRTIFQTLPAIVLDTFLIIIGKKPWAIKMNQKISTLVKTLSCFALKEWNGKNERTKSLWKKISLEDQKIFPFSMHDFDWDDYFQKYMLGIRVYVLKDPVTTIPAARKRQTKIFIILTVVKYTLIILVIWAFYKLFEEYFSF